MDTTLSMCFCSDTVTCTVVRAGEKGLELLAMAVIEESVALRDPQFRQHPSFERVHDTLGSLAPMARSARICLPSSVVMSQCLPDLSNATPEEASSVLTLEVMQNAPETSLDDYDVSFYQVAGSNTEATMMAALVDKKVLDELVSECSSLGLVRSSYSAAYIAALNCFIYNYPERRSGHVLLVGVDCNELILSVVVDGKLESASLRPLNDGRVVEEVLEEHVQKIMQRDDLSIDSMMVYGEALQPALLESIRQRLRTHVPVIERLNAFRMCRASIDETQRKFASRNAHRFVNCVGSVLDSRKQHVSLSHSDASLSLA